ncbi:MAG: transposase [Gammaproteobacteria bacterium]|nr:transposase [Gammaproteobacteria bacterium]
MPGPGYPAVCPAPRSPWLNGVVERANDSARVEFRSQYAGELSVREAGHALADCRYFYNCARPASHSHCSQIIACTIIENLPAFRHTPINHFQSG